MTLEQQIAEICEKHAIYTMSISAVQEDDGLRFYTVMHGDEGGCSYSDLLNTPTVREAIASGIDALNRRRVQTAAVPELEAMA